MNRAKNNVQGFRHLFGPVPSRRLGFSLGVDIIPYKTCTLDCIYCELGRAVGRPTLKRAPYVSRKIILDEIKRMLASGQKIDFITFSGSGEPTLNDQLGKMIADIKQITRIPVAVITNGTLLYKPEVRRDLARADLVLPSLDAATVTAFRRINRPHPDLKLSRIIDGLKRFRKEYQGPIWLEVMLVKGVNDKSSDLKALKEVVKKIKPDRIQLNTVVRPPAVGRTMPLTQQGMKKLRKSFGPGCEVIASFKWLPDKKKDSRLTRQDRQRIYQLVERRPVTENEIVRVLDLPAEEVVICLAELLKEKKIRRQIHQGKRFYTGE